ncbi:MAG: F0F1 ATP synthase subunit gamma [Clostridia bacterium]|nr:F0F1 ATP synthase subunit gamma [Clostridia bacterium]
MTNREIKRRLSSVRETVKITKAMYSISMAKMMAAKSALAEAEKYRDGCLSVLRSLSPSFSESSFFRRKGKRIGFLVIAADKGLCGDHNTLVFQKAEKEMSSAEEKYIFTMGSVLHDLFSKAGKEIDMEYLRFSASYAAAENVADDLLYLYEKDLLDEVKVVYADGVAKEIRVVTLLPFEEKGDRALEVFPKSRETLVKCVRNYLISALRYMLVSASLAENKARARIMSQSTDNAEEMIKDLTAEYNRIRQESITRALQDASVTDGEV